jgi:hypothetical protein
MGASLPIFDGQNSPINVPSGRRMNGSTRGMRWPGNSSGDLGGAGTRGCGGQRGVRRGAVRRIGPRRRRGARRRTGPRDGAGAALVYVIPATVFVIPRGGPGPGRSPVGKFERKPCPIAFSCSRVPV